MEKGRGNVQCEKRKNPLKRQKVEAQAVVEKCGIGKVTWGIKVS